MSIYLVGRRRPIRPLMGRRRPKSKIAYFKIVGMAIFNLQPSFYIPKDHPSQGKQLELKRGLCIEKILCFLQGPFQHYRSYANGHNNDFRRATMPQNTCDIIRLEPPLAHPRHDLRSQVPPGAPTNVMAIWGMHVFICSARRVSNASCVRRRWDRCTSLLHFEDL